MVISISKEFKAVNTKSLVAAIAKEVDEYVQQVGNNWKSESHRETVVELAEDCLSDLREDNKIEQFKVWCDHRNNTSAAMDTGLFNLDLHFRQKHCYNVTKLRYVIKMSQDKQVNLLKSLGIK